MKTIHNSDFINFSQAKWAALVVGFIARLLEGFKKNTKKIANDFIFFMNVAYNVLQVWKMLNKIHEMNLMMWWCEFVIFFFFLRIAHFLLF